MLVYENYIFTYILRFKNCFNKLLYRPLLVTGDGLGFHKYWDCTREGKEHEAEMGGLESSCGWTKSQFMQLIVLISKLWNVACFSSLPALFWGLNKKLKWTCREYYNVKNSNCDCSWWWWWWWWCQHCCPLQPRSNHPSKET